MYYFAVWLLTSKMLFFWPATDRWTIIKHCIQERVDYICHWGKIPQELLETMIKLVEESSIEIIPVIQHNEKMVLLYKYMNTKGHEWTNRHYNEKIRLTIKVVLLTRGSSFDKETRREWNQELRIQWSWLFSSLLFQSMSGDCSLQTLLDWGH